MLGYLEAERPAATDHVSRRPLPTTRRLLRAHSGRLPGDRARGNHYGSRSQRGSEVAALFYGLIESAKLCGVDPKAYLLTAARSALADRISVTLPHALLQ